MGLFEFKLPRVAPNTELLPRITVDVLLGHSMSFMESLSGPIRRFDLVWSPLSEQCSALERENCGGPGAITIIDLGQMAPKADNIETKKRKKRPSTDAANGEELAAGKKRKLKNGKTTESKAGSKFKTRPKIEVETVKGVGEETAKKSKRKPNLAISELPKADRTGNSGVKLEQERTMDYKMYRLKKMKEKWKQTKTKRVRRKENRKTKAPAKKNASEPNSTSEKPLKVPVFGTCDFAELAHHWTQYATSALTTVEREELLLEPEKLATNAKGRELHKFFSKKIPDWKKWVKKTIPNGSPYIIVVCPSAIRATELNRTLNPFKGEKCRTAKLFRKEKTKEQGEFLSNNVVHFAIGTPHRIATLLSHGNLKLDNCRVIALDSAYEDQKKRRLMTIPEVCLDVLQLFHKHFIALLRDQDVSLFLF